MGDHIDAKLDKMIALLERIADERLWQIQDDVTSIHQDVDAIREYVNEIKVDVDSINRRD